MHLFLSLKPSFSSLCSGSTPPVRAKAGPSGRVTASEKTWAVKLCVCRGKDVVQTLKFLHPSHQVHLPPSHQSCAPQPPAGNSQRPSRPQGAAAKPSSRLPVPRPFPGLATGCHLRQPECPTPAKAPLLQIPLSARKGLPRPSAAGHRGKEEQTRIRNQDE